MTAEQAGAGAATASGEALPRQPLRSLVIESEIVIVDDEGHEEPYDSAKH